MENQGTNCAVAEQEILVKYKTLGSLLCGKDINKPHEWCYRLWVSPHTSVVLVVLSTQICPAFVDHHYHTMELGICEHIPENTNTAYKSHIIISNMFHCPFCKICMNATNYQLYQLQVNDWMHKIWVSIPHNITCTIIIIKISCKTQMWNKTYQTIFFNHWVIFTGVNGAILSGMNALSMLNLTEMVSVIAIIKLLALKLEKLQAFCVAVVQHVALQLEVIKTVKLIKLWINI